MRYAFAYGADAVYVGQPRYSHLVVPLFFSCLKLITHVTLIVRVQVMYNSIFTLHVFSIYKFIKHRIKLCRTMLFGFGKLT
jgi:collagenase-like PrtC family protease